MDDLVDLFNTWSLQGHTYEDDYEGRCACGKVPFDCHISPSEICTCPPEEESFEITILNEAGL